MSIKTLKQQFLSDFSTYNAPTSSKGTSKALIKALGRGTKIYLLFNIYS